MADLHRLSRDMGRRRVAELLEMFGLVEVAGKPASTYSGGMRRRLDLAMTLVGDPRLIFLDEPTTELDPRSRRDLWRVIGDLDDPAYRDLYRAFDQAWDWHPCDSRLSDLAGALAEFLATEANQGANDADEAAIDDTAVALLDSQVIHNASPAWKRLSVLLEERGWTGWTKAQRSDKR